MSMIPSHDSNKLLNIKPNSTINVNFWSKKSWLYKFLLKIIIWRFNK